MKLRIGNWEIIIRRHPPRPNAPITRMESLGRKRIATSGRSAL